jgi:transcriptional regulator with XRE-family HTH domain
MSKRGGYIYAIGMQETSYVKIGSTRAPIAKRMQELQVAHPLPLETLAVIEVESDLARIEAQVHKFLAKEWQRGEWFDTVMNPDRLALLVKDAVRVVLEEGATHPVRKSPRDFPLGRRLRLVRRAKNYTQHELAQMSGMNAISLSRLESGNAEHAYARTVRDLAQALGVSADYLLGLTEESGMEHSEEAAAEALVGAGTSAADDALTNEGIA